MSLPLVRLGAPSVSYPTILESDSLRPQRIATNELRDAASWPFGAPVTTLPPVSESTGVRIEAATERDVPLLLQLIRALAEYERLADHVVATEAGLRDALFGPERVAEAAIAYAA